MNTKPDDARPGAGADHKHSGWYCCDQMRRELADRIRDDLCAIVRIPGSMCRPGAGEAVRHFSFDWCLTHNTEQSPGHAFDKGGLGTLD